MRLPDCFEYIKKRFQENEDIITIGKIESSFENGYWGTTYLCTALVPNEDLELLFKSKIRCGYKVENWGPLPIVEKDEKYENDFYIEGLKRKKYGPLVNSWQYHNKTIFLPDNRLLITYGLTNRNINESINWDDLNKPIYNVIENQPYSNYQYERNRGYFHSNAYVNIRRDYLEDYAFLKKASIVAFYYEQRWVKNTDVFIQDMLNSRNIESYEIEANRIKLMTTRFLNYAYNCQVWGRQLVLTPQKSLISNSEELLLKWPNINKPITEKEAMSNSYDTIFVKDLFLKEFEKNNDYKIYPESGSVDYDNRWCIIGTERISRNTIELELKNLYEGNPEYIIEKIHSYSITKANSTQDKLEYGKRHIGIRAKEFVNSFLHLFETIAEFCNITELYFDQEDLIGITTGNVEYNGWYTFEDFQAISNVIEPGCSEDNFQNRAKKLFKIIERISEKNLRKILKQIKFRNDIKIDNYGSIRLIATLFQLIEISINSDLNIQNNMSTINDRFDNDYHNDNLGYIFALNDIRLLESHSTGSKLTQQYNKSLLVFDISRDENKGIGWGISIDKLYDKLIIAFKNIQDIFSKYISENRNIKDVDV